jgi:hypothetical protein
MKPTAIAEPISREDVRLFEEQHRADDVGIGDVCPGEEKAERSTEQQRDHRPPPTSA